MADLMDVASALFTSASMAIAIALAAITWHYSRLLKDSPYLKTWRILYLVSVVLGSVIILDIIGVQETGVRASVLLVALVGFSYVCYRTVPAMQEHMATMQKTMLGLSTPSIEVSEGTLVMPLMGTLDEPRARRLTETLLQDIVRTRARTVIIDVTGITTIDTKTASHLLRTTQAMKLMGTYVIITGIRPQVSETMTQLGIGLEGIPTLRDIPQALDYAQGSRARPALRP